MATYVNDLRLKEIATGDESGTWGTSTNTNLELIGEALGFGTEAITTNADTHTTTVADGSTDPGRAMYIKYTGTLDSTCTITIAPNTMSRMHFIENGTSGSQDIIISQGSGANVTIPAGDVKAVYLDGAGSGAAVTDAFTDLSLAGTTQMTGFTSSSASTITVADNSDNLTLISTDADASSGPNLNLYRNSGSPADNDEVANIAFNGRNDNSQDVKYVEIEAYIRDASDGTEDGMVNFNTMVAGSGTSRMKLDTSETVFNDDSKDLDFRVESDNDANAFFVQGSDGNVGIGTASPNDKLHIKIGTNLNWQFGYPNSSVTTLAALNDAESAYVEGRIDTSTLILNSQSAGNVGIGTTSPDFTNGSGLEIERAGIATLRLTDTGSGGKSFEIFSDDGTGYQVKGLGSGMPMIFSTVSSERMRIESGGNLLVGTTSNSTGRKVHIESASGGYGQLGLRDSAATSGKYWRIGPNSSNNIVVTNQSGVGVYIVDGATSWTGTSDENLKENIVELTGALDKVKDFRCVEYNFIADKTKSKKIGFIAQDWQKDYSQVVSQNNDGNLGIQYTETIPVLLKAIQEQQEQIEQLKTEIQTLKGE